MRRVNGDCCSGSKVAAFFHEGNFTRRDCGESAPQFIPEERVHFRIFALMRIFTDQMMAVCRLLQGRRGQLATASSRAFGDSKLLAILMPASPRRPSAGPRHSPGSPLIGLTAWTGLRPSLGASKHGQASRADLRTTPA
jgi:hypothetical protein